jgi:hypothetical protein
MGRQNPPRMEFQRGYIVKALTIYDIVFAYEKDTGKKYRVFPIYEGEALVSLYPVTNEGLGEKMRIPLGDLWEFYDVYDWRDKE